MYFAYRDHGGGKASKKATQPGVTYSPGEMQSKPPAQSSGVGLNVLSAKAKQLIELTNKETAIALVESVCGVSSMKDVDASQYPELFKALNDAIAKADPAQHLANEMGGKVIEQQKVSSGQLLTLNTTATQNEKDLDDVLLENFAVKQDNLLAADFEEALAVLRS
jgi:hypothetical protein